jgi:hypothetical protein
MLAAGVGRRDDAGTVPGRMTVESLDGREPRSTWDCAAMFCRVGFASVRAAHNPAATAAGRNTVLSALAG